MSDPEIFSDDEESSSDYLVKYTLKTYKKNRRKILNNFLKKHLNKNHIENHKEKLIKAKANRDNGDNRDNEDNRFGTTFDQIPYDFECSVCLNEFKCKSNMIKLNECDHEFCTNCIRMWFGDDDCRSCPLCRTYQPHQPRKPHINIVREMKKSLYKNLPNTRPLKKVKNFHDIYNYWTKYKAPDEEYDEYELMDDTKDFDDDEDELDYYDDKIRQSLYKELIKNLP